jgi:hypothetical protein
MVRQSGNLVMSHELGHGLSKDESGKWGSSMVRFKVSAVYAIICVLISGASARADALLDQVLAGAKADSKIAWRVDRLNTDMTPDGTTKETTLARFDGAAAKGTQWSLVSVNGKAAQEKACNEFSKSFNKGGFSPTYAQLVDMISPAAVRVSSDATGTRYRLPVLPAKAVVAAGYDLSRGLQADFTIDTSGATPFISAFNISAPKPFKPTSVARVDRLSRSMIYMLGPQGLPILKESTVAADFKVLFKNIAVRTRTAFSNQQPVMQTAQLVRPSVSGR